MLKRIAIDASTVDRAVFQGQVRYLVDLFAGLSSLKSDCEFILLGSLDKPLQLLANRLKRIEYYKLPSFEGRGAYYRKMLSYRRVLIDQKISLLHTITGFVPIFTPCPVVTTRLDLMFEIFPEYRAAIRTHVYQMERLMNKYVARRIIAISETTARDVNERWTISRDKIDVVMLGSTFCSRNEKSVLTPHPLWPLSSLVLLTPYNLEPRKNLVSLLRAMPIIRDRFPHVKLVCFGKAGWTSEREVAIQEVISGLKIDDLLIKTGFVDDQTLAVMYEQCSAFIFPSLYEGFGLPVLESMSHAACVIARNSSAMPEVIGDSGVLVETEDPVALADATCNLISDPLLRGKLSGLAVDRAKSFSIERMAAGTVACYERALNGSRIRN